MSKKSTDVHVAVRIRPLNDWERKSNCVETIEAISESSLILTQNDAHGTAMEFHFDSVFTVESTTQQLYDRVAEPIVQSSLQGVNGTMFAYGQTASGKTHTMRGSEKDPGVLRLTAKRLFAPNKEWTYTFKMSYIEIYNERIKDLLSKTDAELKIREDPTRGFFVDGVVETPVLNYEQLMEKFAEGEVKRSVAGTDMNDKSSRSHTILTILVTAKQIENMSTGDFGKFQSRLSLVDLAGSENVRNTNAEGDRLKEGGQINKSLLSLSMVIASLAKSKQDAHVKFRDSKLTQILQPSLVGNCRTAVVCCITPASTFTAETLSTLKFANAAKNIKTEVSVNHVADQARSLKSYQEQVEALQNTLRLERLDRVDPGELQSCKRRLDEKQDELSRLLFQFKQTMEEAKGFKSTVSERERECRNLENLIEANRFAFVNFETEREVLKKESAVFKLQIMKAESDRDDWMFKATTSAKAEKFALESENAKQREAIKRLEGDSNKMEKDLNDALKEQSKLKRVCLGLESMCEDEKTKFGKLQREYQSESTHALSESKRLAGELNESKAHASELDSSISVTRNQNVALNSEMVVLTRERERLGEIVSKAQRDALVNEQRILTNDTSRRELESKLQSAMNTIGTLKTEFTRVTNQADQDARAKQLVLAGTQAKLETESKRCTSLQQSLDQAGKDKSATHAELSQKLVGSESKRIELERALADTHREAAVLESAVNVGAKDLTLIREALAAAQIDRDEVRAKMQAELVLIKHEHAQIEDEFAYAKKSWQSRETELLHQEALVSHSLQRMESDAERFQVEINVLHVAIDGVSMQSSCELRDVRVKAEQDVAHAKREMDVMEEEKLLEINKLRIKLDLSLKEHDDVKSALIVMETNQKQVELDLQRERLEVGTLQMEINDLRFDSHGLDCERMYLNGQAEVDVNRVTRELDVAQTHVRRLELTAKELETNLANAASMRIKLEEDVQGLMIERNEVKQEHDVVLSARSELAKRVGALETLEMELNRLLNLERDRMGVLQAEINESALVVDGLSCELNLEREAVVRVQEGMNETVLIVEGLSFELNSERDTVVQLQAEINETILVVDGLSSELEIALGGTARARELVGSVEFDLVETRASELILKQSLKEMRVVETALQRELGNCQSLLVKEQTHVAGLEVDLLALQIDLNDNDVNMFGLTQELSVVLNEVKQSEAALKSYQIELGKNSQRCEALQGEVEKWTVKCDGLQMSLDASTSETGLSVARLQRELGGAQSQCVGFETELAKKSQRCGTLQGEVEKWTAKCNGLQATLDSATSESGLNLARLQRELGEAQSQCGDFETKLAKESQRCGALQGEIEKWTAKCTGLQVSSDSVTSESGLNMARLQRELGEAHSQRVNCETEMSLMNIASEQLQAIVNELSCEATGFEHELKCAHAAGNESKLQLNVVLVEIARLQCEHDELQMKWQSELTVAQLCMNEMGLDLQGFEFELQSRLVEVNVIKAGRDRLIGELQADSDGHVVELQRVRYAHVLELQTFRNTHVVELQTVQDAHAVELKAVRGGFAGELHSIHDAHFVELNFVRDGHASKVQFIRDEHVVELRAACDRFEAELRVVRDGFSVTSGKLESSILAGESALAQLNQSFLDVQAEHAVATRDLVLARDALVATIESSHTAMVEALQVQINESEWNCQGFVSELHLVLASEADCKFKLNTIQRNLESTSKDRVESISRLQSQVDETQKALDKAVKEHAEEHRRVELVAAKYQLEINQLNLEINGIEFNTAVVLIERETEINELHLEIDGIEMDFQTERVGLEAMAVEREFRFQAEQAGLEETLHERETEIDELKMKFDHIEMNVHSELAKLEATVLKRETDINELNLEIDGMEMSFQALRTCLEATLLKRETEINELHLEIDGIEMSVQSEVAGLEAKVLKRETEINELNLEIDGMEMNAAVVIIEHQSELNELHLEMDGLTMDLNARLVQAQLEINLLWHDLAGERQELGLQSSRDLAEIQTLNSRVAGLQHSVNQLEFSANASTEAKYGELVKARADVDALQRLVNELACSVDGFEMETRALTESAADVSSANNASAKIWASSIASLETELFESAKSLGMNIDSLTRDMIVHEDTNRALRSELVGRDDAERVLTDEIVVLRGELMGGEDAARVVKGEIGLLRTDLAGREDDARVITCELNTLRAQLAVCEESAHAMAGGLDSLRAELAAREESVHAMTGELQILHTELSGRDGSIHAMAIELAAREESVKSLTIKIASLQTSLVDRDQLIEEIAILRTTIADREECAISLRAKVDSLEVELSNSEKRLKLKSSNVAADLQAVHLQLNRCLEENSALRTEIAEWQGNSRSSSQRAHAFESTLNENRMTIEKLNSELANVRANMAAQNEAFAMDTQETLNVLNVEFATKAQTLEQEVSRMRLQFKEMDAKEIKLRRECETSEREMVKRIEELTKEVTMRAVVRAEATSGVGAAAAAAVNDDAEPLADLNNLVWLRSQLIENQEEVVRLKERNEKLERAKMTVKEAQMMKSLKTENQELKEQMSKMGPVVANSQIEYERKISDAVEARNEAFKALNQALESAKDKETKMEEQKKREVRALEKENLDLFKKLKEATGKVANKENVVPVVVKSDVKAAVGATTTAGVNAEDISVKRRKTTTAASSAPLQGEEQCSQQ